jgi:hypothetical protein
MALKKYQWGGWNNNWGNTPVDPSDPSYTYNTLLQSDAPFTDKWLNTMRDLELQFQVNAPGQFDEGKFNTDFTNKYGNAPTATSYTPSNNYSGSKPGSVYTGGGYSPSWAKQTNNNTGFGYNGVGSGNLGQINPQMSYNNMRNTQLEAAKKKWEEDNKNYTSNAQNAMKFIGPIGALMMGNKGEEAYKNKSKDNLNPELGFYGFNYQDGGYAPPESQGINYLTKPESEKDRLIREKLERVQRASNFGKNQIKKIEPYLDAASAIPFLGRFPAALFAGMNMGEGNTSGAGLNFLTAIAGKTLGQETSALAKVLNKGAHGNHLYHKAHLAEQALLDSNRVNTPYVDTSKIQRRDNTLVSSFQSGGFTNLTGYTPGYQTFNNPYNVIPSNNISLQNTPFALMGVADNGQSKVMLPGNSYKFPGASKVLEIPMKNKGGYSEEMDLSLEQIMELRKQGYKVEVQ